MFTRRRLAGLLVVLVLAGAGGAAGYDRGVDDRRSLSAAREAGARAGEIQGADRGSQGGYNQGFRAGFRHGKAEGYRKTYYKLLAKAGVRAPELTSDGGSAAAGSGSAGGSLD